MKLRRYRILLIAAADFMGGVMLGRWSVKREWLYLCLTFGYMSSVLLWSVAMLVQVKREEAELRQLMKDVERLQKEVDEEVDDD